MQVEAPYIGLRKHFEDQDMVMTDQELEMAKKLLCRVTTDSECGDSAITHFIFEDVESEEEIRQICRMYGISIDGHRCNYEHDCCGCWSSYSLVVSSLGKLLSYAYQFHSRNV